MSVRTALTRPRRRRIRGGRTQPALTPPASPLPESVRERIRLSADVLTALLDVEGRERPTLDDIEWADALAARLARRPPGRHFG